MYAQPNSNTHCDTYSHSHIYFYSDANCYTHSNSHCDTYCHSHIYFYSDVNCYTHSNSNTYIYTKTYTDAQVGTDTTHASYSGATTVSFAVISDSRGVNRRLPQL